ncbi:hypothetical protein F4604DRAFT_968883 [Suillus subluteus]|nr:hypothetical protein F4604DRAFT_968883 [Suillus subluteus]
MEPRQDRTSEFSLWPLATQCNDDVYFAIYAMHNSGFRYEYATMAQDRQYNRTREVKAKESEANNAGRVRHMILFQFFLLTAFTYLWSWINKGVPIPWSFEIPLNGNGALPGQFTSDSEGKNPSLIMLRNPWVISCLSSDTLLPLSSFLPFHSFGLDGGYMIGSNISLQGHEPDAQFAVAWVKYHDGADPINVYMDAISEYCGRCH